MKKRDIVFEAQVIARRRMATVKAIDDLGFQPRLLSPLCGLEWLESHVLDHSQQEIDDLGMEIITERSKTTIKAGMKPTNVRTAIKATVKTK